MTSLVSGTIAPGQPAAHAIEGALVEALESALARRDQARRMDEAFGGPGNAHMLAAAEKTLLRAEQNLFLHRLGKAERL